MVFAIRCPAPACRKYMFVEEAQQGTSIRCPICGIAIRTGPKPASPKDSDPSANAIRGRVAGP